MKYEELKDGCFYWVTIGGEETIGKWGKVIIASFEICGSDEIVRFDKVSNIRPVCTEH